MRTPRESDRVSEDEEPLLESRSLDARTRRSLESDTLRLEANPRVMVEHLVSVVSSSMTAVGSSTEDWAAVARLPTETP